MFISMGFFLVAYDAKVKAEGGGGRVRLRDKISFFCCTEGNY
jgi:hypothetical protein